MPVLLSHTRITHDFCDIVLRDAFVLLSVALPRCLLSYVVPLVCLFVILLLGLVELFPFSIALGKTSTLRRCFCFWQVILCFAA